MLTWDERVRIKGKIHGKENKNQIRGIKQLKQLKH